MKGQDLNFDDPCGSLSIQDILLFYELLRSVLPPSLKPIAMWPAFL